ncbi:MAG TPA: triose-phosphate isomerase [Luteibaculaceae bacterium]|nr:triose-phosphate isomerase [Luteibaculaceae bacterium]
MRKIVAGNWKMNLLHKEAVQLLEQLLNESTQIEGVDLIIAPPALYLADFAARIPADGRVKLSAQNVYFQPSGAFTGEVSAPMLAALGVAYCIVGHSERRSYFGETNFDVNQKIKALLDAGVCPIVCVGERLEERYKNVHVEVVAQQLEEAFDGLSSADMAHVVVAYEPVWAIGTGQTATSEQAQEMHAEIRHALNINFNESVVNEIPVLYGGSCNAANAAELFAQPDVNGGLVGGASLKASDFMAIARSF